MDRIYKVHWKWGGMGRRNLTLTHYVTVTLLGDLEVIPLLSVLCYPSTHHTSLKLLYSPVFRVDFLGLWCTLRVQSTMNGPEQSAHYTPVEWIQEGGGEEAIVRTGMLLTKEAITG